MNTNSTYLIDNCVNYLRIGCEIAGHGTWRTAPADAIVIALKELPEEDDSPLCHTHIMFGHCYKSQGGWREILARFQRGNGLLLDLEFLVDDKGISSNLFLQLRIGRRIAAFGYHAGFAGSALGIDLWCHQQLKGVERLDFVPEISFESVCLSSCLFS